MLLPSLTGVVEAASDLKESNTEKIVASQKEKIEEKKKEVQEDKAEVKEAKEEVKETKPEAKKDLEDILTVDEIQEIRTRTNSLENSYFFNGNMVEELKAELRKAKADPSVNYQEAKARLIAEAITKNIPTQKAPGEDRAVKDFGIKKPENLKSGDKEVIVEGEGMEQGQIIDVLVNNVVKGSFTQPKRVRKSAKIKLDEALKENDKVKAVLKSADGNTILDSTDVYNTNQSDADKYKDKLQMPTGEILIEQTSSNQVNDDEQAEAVQMFNNVNTAIAGDIKSVKFSINTAAHAYYEVTYTDGSTSGKIEATNLKIKQVTDYSQSPSIEKTYVADGKITITFKNEIAKGSKIGIIQTIDANEKDKFCSDEGTCSTGKCKITKSTVKWVSVDASTKTFTYKVDDDFLKLGEDFGVIVKEPHKFASCKKTQPEVKIPNVGVRDPKKLTETEKDKIREEIRKANTTKGGTGVSKLPDGIGDNTGIPAVIQIDDQGNVKVISGNDVEVKEWDSDGNAIPETNPDGSVKLKGITPPVKTAEPKEVLTNLAPNQPTVGYDKTKGVITVTPDPADTDAKTIKVTYKDPEGTEKTETATKGENGKWSVPDGSTIKVDEKTGVVTIKDSDIQNKTNVSAIVTDNGGIATTDQEKKTSDNKSEQIKIYPKKPEITINDQDGSVTITPVDKDNDKVAKKMDITYTPAGQDTTKTVTVERKDDGTWTVPEGTDFKVSEDGKSITITNDKIKSKSDITAKTNDGDANEKLESDPDTKQVPDKNAPQPPKVEVDIKTGKASITPPSDPDVKIIEVKYIGTDGEEKTAKAEKTGENKWKVTGEGVSFNTAGCIFIPHANLKRASEITAIATDEDGNKSTEGIDTSLPPAPTAKESEGVITVTPPENTPAVNGMEITYTPDGSEETKTFKVVKGTDDKWKIDGENTPEGVTVDENGTVTIADGKAKEKTKVTAISSIDTNKKSLEKGEVEVPESKAPEAPTVKVQDNGSVTITPKDKGETTVTVTYKDKDGQDKIATATKGKNGEWTVDGDNGETIDKTNGVITIPNGNTNPGDRVRATAKKGSKTSEEGKDLTKPAPPTVTPDQESGNVTITPPTKGNLDGMIIKYKKPDGSDGTIKVKKDNGGTWTFYGENPDAEGVEVNGQSGVVTIKKGHAKEKTPVTADSTIETLKTPDKNQGQQPELVPDKTNPNPPTVNVEENTGNITITPPKDEDTTSVTVNYKDKDGNAKTAIATKDNDGWKATKNENGETVDKTTGVITLAKGSYKTGEAVTAYGNDDVNNKSSENNQIPVEVKFDLGNSSKSIEGKILAKGGSYVLPTTLEKEYYPEGMLFEGWEINGVDQKAGASITINIDTVVKAKWKSQAQPDPQPNPNEPQNPSQPESPTVTEDDNGTTIVPRPDTDKVVIPTTDENGENPIDVVVEQDDKGKWENKNNVPGVTVDPDTGKTTIPSNRKVDKNNIIVESKPNVKPEEPSYEEYEIPGIKIRDHYTPTFPVYVTVPKTEKVEKAEEVPVSLETHKAYIAGYEDNTLRAEGNLTRAEAAAMVTRLAGLDLSDNSMPAFKDMQKNAWYFRYINAAVKAKMLDADNGMMRPNDKITRAEFAKMLAAIDKENSSVSKFDDIKGHRYEKEINKIYGNNRIEGYEDGSFRPDAYLTRAESAAFLNRMFNRIADKEAYAGLEDKLAKFKDFDASKWYYDEMVEATNSHELTRRGKASDKFGRVYEKWTRILPSDVK